MSRDYCEYVIDLLASWAKVTARAMFGAHGIYRQGKIFAIVDNDTLYFKVSVANRPDYEAAGSSPLTYAAKGKTINLPYWRVPDEVLEDQEELNAWADKAYRVALQKLNKRGSVRSPLED